MAVRSCVTLIDQSVSQLRLHTAGAQQKTRRRNRSATRRLRRNGWATSSWQKGNISLLSSIRFSFFLSTGKRLHCLHTHKERERESENLEIQLRDTGGKRNVVLRRYSFSLSCSHVRNKGLVIKLISNHIHSMSTKVLMTWV